MKAEDSADRRGRQPKEEGMGVTVKSTLLAALLYVCIFALAQQVEATECTGVGQNRKSSLDTPGSYPPNEEWCCKFAHFEGLGIPDSASCDPGEPVVTLHDPDPNVNEIQSIASAAVTHYGSAIGHYWVVKVCGPKGTTVYITVKFTNSFGEAAASWGITIPGSC